MDGPVDREEAVYLAKLAEQAERYDEMASWTMGSGRWAGVRGILASKTCGVAGARSAPWRVQPGVRALRSSVTDCFCFPIPLRLCPRGAPRWRCPGR